MLRAGKKKWTRSDYVKFLNLPKKNKRMKKPKSSRGDIIIPDLLLPKMISKKNRNRAQRDAIIDTMNTGQMDDISHIVKAFLKTPYKLNRKQINMLMKNQEFAKGLTNGHIPVKIRKKIIKQRGGILGLIPLAAKVIAPTLLGSIADKLFRLKKKALPEKRVDS